MATYIRRAQEADLFKVEALIEDAKQVLKLHDNPQWQDGHPELATLKNDIQNGNNWLLMMIILLAPRFFSFKPNKVMMKLPQDNGRTQMNHMQLFIG